MQPYQAQTYFWCPEPFPVLFQHTLLFSDMPYTFLTNPIPLRFPERPIVLVASLFKCS